MVYHHQPFEEGRAGYMESVQNPTSTKKSKKVVSIVSKEEKLRNLLDWLRSKNAQETLKIHGRKVNAEGWNQYPPGGYEGARSFNRGIRLAVNDRNRECWLLYRNQDFSNRTWREGVVIVTVANVCPASEYVFHLQGITILAGPDNLTPETFEGLGTETFPIHEVIQNLWTYIHEQAMYHRNVADKLFILEGSFMERVRPG